MATGRIVERRPLRCDAGSPSSVLCSSCVSDRAADAMGPVLEKHRFEKLATCTRTAIWQRDFWDTQLRRSENYDSKWQYVVDNPVRAGLAREADEWPFQGELSFLPW